MLAILQNCWKKSKNNHFTKTKKVERTANAVKESPWNICEHNRMNKFKLKYYHEKLV